MKSAETFVWCLLLIFIIFFIDCIPGSVDTVTSLRLGFRSERAAAGIGPSGSSSVGGYKRNTRYNMSCVLQTYCNLSTNKNCP